MKTPRSFLTFLTVALVFLALTTSVRAVPPFIADPGNGEEFDEKLTFIFTEPMQQQVAVSFSGTGGAEFGCGWLVLVEGQPLQFLECEVESGELPSGATVTWTINPGGAGMTTVSGTVLAETSGTFVAPTLTGVTISVSPSDGAIYDPEIDGPVIFTFNVPMDTSVSPDTAISFNTGTWNSNWVGTMSIQSILSGDPIPVDYSYTVSGLVSAEGAAAPELTGGFTIADDGGGDVEIFPSPGEGETLTPTPGLPTQVLFVFSESMDPTVDIDAAITFSMGDWDCSWTQILPTLPVNGCSCSPVGVLPGGTYEYTLSGLKTAAGGTVPDFVGTFVVDGPGTGGGGEITGGTPAPDCEIDAMMLPLPKSFYVCGSDLFSWFGGSAIPSYNGSGYVIDASADVTGGSLSSMLLLDDDGMQTGGVIATDVGVRFDGWPDQNLILVEQGGTAIQPDLSFGVFDLSSGASVNTFQHKIAVGGDDVTSSFLPDGRVLLIRDSNEEIELMVFSQNGTLDWAKRFTSSEFGVDTSTGASSQAAHVTPIDGGGFLLVVTKREIMIDTNGGNPTATRTATAVIAQLTASGTVQWSRRYTSNGELDSLNVTGPFQDGSIVLSGSYSDGTMGSASSTSIVAKLSSNGNVTWAKQVDGAFLSAMGVTTLGKILVGGGQGSGQNLDMLFMVMGITGNIENQVLFDNADIDVGFANVGDDRIYFSLLSSDIPSINPTDPDADFSTRQTAVIGSSTLSLSGFQWKEYFRPVTTAFLGMDRDSAGLSFSAFREDTHRLDVVELDSNLNAAGNCDLFTNVNLTPQNPGLSALNTTLQSSNASVTVADFSPELLAADISVQDFVAGEADVCDDGGVVVGGCDAPVSLSIAEAGAGMISIGFTTVPGCSHTLQRSVSLGPVAVWIPVEVINGTGAAYSGEFALGAGTEFYRVVSQD